MNLGEKVSCGIITPLQIGLDGQRAIVMAGVVDAKSITINGQPLCIGDLDDSRDVDSEVAAGSENLVTSGAVHTAIESLGMTKQNALTVNGQPINPEVLNTFALAASGSGVGYSNSLLTAGAIENWFETLQDSLLMISPGQAGPGYRTATINAVSPSSVNVPSAMAVRNHVQSQISNAALPKITGSESPPITGHPNTGMINDIEANSLVNLSISGAISAYEWNTSLGEMSQIVPNVVPAVAWTSFDSDPFPRNSSDYNPCDLGGQSNDSSQYGYNMSGALVTGSVLSSMISTIIGFPSSVVHHLYHAAAGNAMPSLYQVIRSLYTAGSAYAPGVTMGATDSVSGSLVDELPTENSDHMVCSRGIYAALSEKHPYTPTDPSPEIASTNLVTSGGVRAAIDDLSSVYQPIGDDSHTHVMADVTDLSQHLKDSYEPIHETIQSFTSSRSNTGIYYIRFGTPLVRSAYTIILTAEASQGTVSSELDDDYMLSYINKSVNGFNVVVSEQDNSTNAGVLVNCRFDFVVFQSGKVVCHGSVRADGVQTPQL
jgi:hypothetical protein